MTSSWFFLSTLNYDARSTTHQIHLKVVSSEEHCTDGDVKDVIEVDCGQAWFLKQFVRSVGIIGDLSNIKYN